MESFQAFRFGFWDALRLSFAFHHNDPSKTARHFSAGGKALLVLRKPPHRVDRHEATSSPDVHLHELAKPAEEGQRDFKPQPVLKSCTGGNPLNKFWRQFRKQNSPLSNEEFKNLRNDDFPWKKRRIQENPSSIKRTEGSEILFGVAPCALALQRSKRDFFQLFLNPNRDRSTPTVKELSWQAKDRGIPIKWVTRNALDVLCHGGVHQGVCLEATPLHPIGWQEGPPLDCTGGREGLRLLWLVLERILDPMNLGAILRSAHFLGVDRIVISQKNSCPLTPVVSKASSGAMEVLDVFATDDLQGFLKAKSEEGWEILGTTGTVSPLDDIPVVSCLDFHWTRPTVLILGNEGSGLSPEVRSLCQRMLTVSPGRELEPGIECLNVSVAAGILLHSICSQKKIAPKDFLSTTI